MIDYIAVTYVISTIIIWVVFWSRMQGLESELNAYYYVPSLENTIVDLYIKNDAFSVFILFIPIANFIFIIRCMLEDHIALLEEIADSIGAVPIKTDKGDKGE